MLVGTGAPATAPIGAATAANAKKSIAIATVVLMRVR
jgi:hypothetical protein